MSKWHKKPEEPTRPCGNPGCKKPAARHRQHPHLSRKYCSGACGQEAWHAKFTAENGATYWSRGTEEATR